MKQYMMRFMIVLAAIFLQKDACAMKVAAGNIRVLFIRSYPDMVALSVDVPRDCLFASEIGLKEAVTAYFGFDAEQVEQPGDEIKVTMSKEYVDVIGSVAQLTYEHKMFYDCVNDFLDRLENNVKSLASCGMLHEHYQPQMNRALNSPFGRYRMHSMVVDHAKDGLPAQLMGNMKKAIGKIKQTANNKQSQLDENYKQFFYDLADDFDNELINTALENDSLLKEKHYTYLGQYPEVIEKHIQEKRKKLSPQEVEAKKQQIQERMQQFAQQNAHDADLVAQHKAVMQALIDELSSTGKKSGVVQKQNTSSTTQSIPTQLSAISTSTLIKIGILAVGAAVITWVAVKFYNHGNKDEQREDAQKESSSAMPSQQRENTALIA